jgi:hypothetical protein
MRSIERSTNVRPCSMTKGARSWTAASMTRFSPILIRASDSPSLRQTEDRV